MLKADLRRTALAQRKALSEAEVALRSEALRQQLFQHVEVAKWQWLHVFLPIPQQHEPNTWKIIRWIWEHELPVQLAVPVIQADGVSLRHYHLTPTIQLADNRWGIPEPVGATEVAPTQLDAVLIPLLAFDEAGHRVGYGKGFYDRFLQECRPDVLRIGLSLEPPVPSITDVWPGDVLLTACVTPGGVWQFGQ
jgi:5-formyltetrahydrofolate cyclo-ligase